MIRALQNHQHRHRLACVSSRSAILIAVVLATLICSFNTWLLHGFFFNKDYIFYNMDLKDTSTRSLTAGSVRHEDTAKESSTRLVFRSLEIYKRQHAKVPENHSSFSLIHFACPDRAGNYLHNLFNNVVWSILANRTILIQYYQQEDMERSSCQNIMPLPSWMHLWDDYSQSLPSTSAFPVWTQNSSYTTTLYTHPNEIPLVIFPHIPDFDLSNQDIERCKWSDHPVSNTEYRKFIDKTFPSGRQIAADLFQYGQAVLYGKLFEEIFSTSWKMRQPHPKYTFTAALHSRHIGKADDGQYVNNEIGCLERILPPNRSLETCAVHLLSDRPKTLALLEEWLFQHQCTPLFVKHHQKDPIDHISGIEEHGPHAGEAFLEELTVASAARDGIIGDVRRSSFQLLHEMIQYQRAKEEHRPDSNIKLCKLPSHSVEGYDYGPGSPTFIRDPKFIPPLIPNKVLDEYHTTKSSDIYEGVLECPVSADSIRYAINQYIHAIVQNRIIAWRFAAGDTDCWKTSQELQLRSAVILLDEESTSRIKYNISSEYEKFPAHVLIKQYAEEESTAATLRSLYAHGTNYLYGMLLEDLFHFQVSGHSLAGKATNLIVSTPERSQFDEIIACVRTLQNSIGPCNMTIFFNGNNPSHLLAEVKLKTQCSVGSLLLVSNETEKLKLFGEIFVNHRQLASTSLVSDQNDLLVDLFYHRHHSYKRRLGRFPPFLSDISICFLNV